MRKRFFEGNKFDSPDGEDYPNFEEVSWESEEEEATEEYVSRLIASDKLSRKVREKEAAEEVDPEIKDIVEYYCRPTDAAVDDAEKRQEIQSTSIRSGFPGCGSVQ